MCSLPESDSSHGLEINVDIGYTLYKYNYAKRTLDTLGNSSTSVPIAPMSDFTCAIILQLQFLNSSSSSIHVNIDDDNAVNIIIARITVLTVLVEG